MQKKKIKKRGRTTAPTSKTEKQSSLLHCESIYPHKDSYVLPVDLYEEPTQKRLRQTSVEYVPFLTYDNALLDKLYSAVNTSPTTRSIVRQKAQMSLGDGFSITTMDASISIDLKRGERFATGDITDEQILQFIDWMKKSNLQGESFIGISDKIEMDYHSFGNTFVEMVRTTVDGQKSFQVRHVPIYLVRPKKASKYVMMPTEVGISEDWEEDAVTPQHVVDIKLYPQWTTFEEIVEAVDEQGNKTEQRVTVERSIIHLKNYNPGFVYWGLPDWIAGLLWAEMEYRIPKYNQSKFDNGYTPSAIVQFFGEMAPKEAKQLIDNFKKAFTGTGNNSKMFAQVIRDEAYKASVDVLQDTNEGNFMELADLASQAIVTAHRWTKSMAGITTAGQLGNAQQMRTEIEFIQNTVIRPHQIQLLTQVINPIIEEASLWLETNWDMFIIDILNSVPVSFMGSIKVEDVLTINEQRELLGYPPLETPENTEENADI